MSVTVIRQITRGFVLGGECAAPVLAAASAANRPSGERTSPGYLRQSSMPVVAPCSKSPRMAKKESSGFNKPFEGLKRLAQKPPAPARPAPARPAPPKPSRQTGAGFGQAAASDDERSFAEAMRERSR